MTHLQRFWLSPRWLVLLVAFAAIAVTTAALLPHDDSEERSCLVCKASQQPVSELASLSDSAPPIVPISLAPVHTSGLSSPPDIESGPPRAPPA